MKSDTNMTINATGASVHEYWHDPHKSRQTSRTISIVNHSHSCDYRVWTPDSVCNAKESQCSSRRKHIYSQSRMIVHVNHES